MIRLEKEIERRYHNGVLIKQKEQRVKKIKRFIFDDLPYYFLQFCLLLIIVAQILKLYLIFKGKN